MVLCSRGIEFNEISLALVMVLECLASNVSEVDTKEDLQSTDFCEIHINDPYNDC